MKLFVALALVLAIITFTQAQGDSEQPEASDPDATVFDPERQRPLRPEGSERPLKPERPGTRPHISRPQPNENQLADNDKQENNSPQGWPLRRQVFFDINFDFGKQNQIGGNSEATTIPPSGK